MSGKDTHTKTNFFFTSARLAFALVFISHIPNNLSPSISYYFSRRSPKVDREVWTKVGGEPLQRIGDSRRDHGWGGKHKRLL